MITGKNNLPPCSCGDPDWFHDGPCRPPTTLENVVRSPRLYAFLRDPDQLEAGGWVVLIRNGDKVEQLDGHTIDDAITAAALRIAALDAAERKEPPPSPEGRSPRPEEVKP